MGSAPGTDDPDGRDGTTGREADDRRPRRRPRRDPRRQWLLRSTSMAIRTAAIRQAYIRMALVAWERGYRTGHVDGREFAIGDMFCVCQACEGRDEAAYEAAYDILFDQLDVVRDWRNREGPLSAPPRACRKNCETCGVRRGGKDCCP